MSPDRKKWRVILAGDGPDVRAHLAGLFCRLECSVETVESPDAFSKVGVDDESLFFVVDLDSHRYNWLATVLSIRKRVALSRIPILLTSSDGGRGIEFFSDVQLFGDAPIEYLPGPVSIDELAFQVRRFLTEGSEPVARGHAQDQSLRSA